jgi:hypothetical protein
MEDGSHQSKFDEDGRSDSRFFAETERKKTRKDGRDREMT